MWNIICWRKADSCLRRSEQAVCVCVCVCVTEREHRCVHTESQMSLALSVLLQTTRSQNMGQAQHVSFYRCLVIGLFKSLCVFQCVCVFVLFLLRPETNVSLSLSLSLTLSLSLSPSLPLPVFMWLACIPARTWAIGWKSFNYDF